MNKIIFSSNKSKLLSKEPLELMAGLVFDDQLTDLEISKKFNMSKPTFYKVKNTEKFQSALKQRGEVAIREASAKIQACSDKATRVLIRLMDEGSESNQLKAAIEVLRLAGLNQKLPEFTIKIQETSHKALILHELKKLNKTESKGGK